MTTHEALRVWGGWQSVQKSGVIQSAVALDDKRIAITLSHATDSVPRVLADPAFSLAIDPAQRAPGLKFEWLPNVDPRDALDRSADLVVSRDPALVEYVSARPEFVSFPLPWSRTYVLVAAAGQDDGLVRASSPGLLRESLARDAVPADARAAEPPFWWNDLEVCPARAQSAPGSRSSRVVYLRGDEVARALAERIVALAGTSAGLRTAALDPNELRAALQADVERAYVLALLRHSLAPCRDTADWPLDASILPLIETRAHAVVRRGAPPLAVEWDGSVRVDDEIVTRSP